MRAQFWGGRGRTGYKLKSVVERVCDPSGSDCYWVIRPNCSLSWEGALKVYLVIAACCLGIGIAFAVHGFWTVLPFAGFEVIVLAAAFYLCISRGQIREVVTINADIVTVEKGRRQPLEHWECPRVFARVILEHSPIAWYPSRLALASREQRVEIGRFLNEEERCELAEDLEGVIRRTDWFRGDQ